LFLSPDKNPALAALVAARWASKVSSSSPSIPAGGLIHGTTRITLFSGDKVLQDKIIPF
jgi:hypothetical protein